MKEQLKMFCRNWTYADYVIAATLLVFPVYNRLMPILLVLLGATLFFQRRNFSDFRQDFLSPSKPYIWFVLFFLVHVFGLLNTTDVNEGWNDIGMKASLILMPIILLMVSQKMTRNQMIYLILLGLLIACVFAYSKAIFKSIYHKEDNNWAYFTGAYLSYGMHKSYFATYLVLGVLLSIRQFFKYRLKQFLFFGMLFSVTTLLTFSKAGIIALVLSVPITLFYFTIKYFNFKRAMIISSGFMLVLVIAFASSSKLRVRFEKMFEAIVNPQINPEKLESNASRIVAWQTSWELFAENPIMGVGTGDVNEELHQRNVERGYNAIAEKQLNSHNQYLNSFVQLGLIGGIPLLLIFLTSGHQGVSEKSFILIAAVFIFAFSLIFESFFERQSGVMPITFLLCLFTLKAPRFN